MSLVTRCTSCGTLFKVVADQLKISEGWVRCGQCATVFDAQSNLVQAAAAQNLAARPSVDAPASPPVQIAQIPSEPPPHAPAALEPQAHADAEYSIASEIASFRSSKLQGSGMLAEYIMPANSQIEPPTKTTSDSANSSVPDDALAQFDASASDQHVQLSSDEPTTFFPVSAMDKSQWPDSMDESAKAVSSPSTDAVATVATTATTAEPSFIVQAQRAQRWRSPWVRLGLGLLCIGLIAALAAQVAVFDKDYIAARWPQAKPWLDRVCQPLGCQVQAFKRIEAISVDASSFNRINKNNALLESISQSYRLGVTLKNTGALPVAMPHVELTLQDAQDQSILRRVLSPADLGSSLISLAPAQDMAGSLTLQIDTAQLAGSRIQGYRVLAFYP